MAPLWLLPRCGNLLSSTFVWVPRCSWQDLLLCFFCVSHGGSRAKREVESCFHGCIIVCPYGGIQWWASSIMTILSVWSAWLMQANMHAPGNAVWTPPLMESLHDHHSCYFPLLFSPRDKFDETFLESDFPWSQVLYPEYYEQMAGRAVYQNKQIQHAGSIILLACYCCIVKEP